MKIMSFIAMGLVLLSTAVSASENVARSTFTTDVAEREPIDTLGQLTNDNEKVYFFTEITGMAGHTITHRWEHGGDVKAEVKFNVGADRWRIWSSKNLQPQWVGEWVVTVMDEEGKVLAEESMAYVPMKEMDGMSPEAMPEEMHKMAPAAMPETPENTTEMMTH